jgi:hypothetical protein
MGKIEIGEGYANPSTLSAPFCGEPEDVVEHLRTFAPSIVTNIRRCFEY